MILKLSKMAGRRLRIMTKSKVKCPRCFSDDLYKFGKDKYGNQVSM